LLGNALFQRVMDSPSGFVFSIDPYEETWARVETGDGRVHLVVDELVQELRGLETGEPVADADYPFVLAAGERRSDSANTLFRDPSWRKEGSGTLRLSPRDAEELGLCAGMQARITTRRGSVVAPVEITDTLRPGHTSLPNGYGLAYPDSTGKRIVHGASPNELTASEDRDWLAGTPWHKHVRARIEVASDEECYSPETL
jgi:anaerobic selenocysteine-containing dehydrogenase